MWSRFVNISSLAVDKCKHGISYDNYCICSYLLHLYDVCGTLENRSQLNLPQKGTHCRRRMVLRNPNRILLILLH